MNRNRIHKIVFLICLCVSINEAKSQDCALDYWTHTVGGNGIDEATTMSVDAQGNVIIGGYFEGSADFDPSSGVESHQSNGFYDYFLSKFGPDGSYLWTRTAGGEGHDFVTGIAVDAQGNISIVGAFSASVDFDPGPGTDLLQSNANDDIFLSQFGPDGSYHWTRVLGGSAYDYVLGVATNVSGDIWIAGTFRDIVDFNPGPETDLRAAIGGNDFFVSKFGIDASYQWTQTIGGNGLDNAQAIAVDNQSNVYVAGYFQNSVDFDPGPMTDLHSSNGNRDIFLSHFDSNGVYQWTRSMGSNGVDEAFAITVKQNTLYVAGQFANDVDFNPGPEIDMRHANGAQDAFLCSFDVDGSYRWARSFGSGQNDGAYSVVADSLANVWVCGFFRNNVDFDPDIGADFRSSNGGNDIFVSRFDSNGNHQWVQTTGGTGTDEASAIALASSGSILLTGMFWNSIDFDPSANVDLHISSGFTDCFLSRWNGGALISSSVPANQIIDARQPFAPNGGELLGIQEIEIELSCSPDLLPTANDFVIQTEGAQTSAPQIAKITDLGNRQIRLTLNKAIEAGAWTTTLYQPRNQAIRLGYLPGDSNGDASTSPVDILNLINSLNGVISLALHSTDIDRSGISNPADILRLIDLLNGAGEFEPWNGVSLP